MSTLSLFISWLLDMRRLDMTPGLLALALIGYHMVFEATDIADDLDSVLEGSLSEQIQRADTNICMYPGEQQFIEALREKLSAFETKFKRKYPEITLTCARSRGLVRVREQVDG